MSHRLLIIRPTHYQSRTDRSPLRRRRRSVVPLTLPYLAVLTPKDWEVTLIDEEMEGVDFGVRADLVAISSWTLNSIRAYDLADEFRRRGTPVVLGGPHTCFHTEEAMAHCDAVAVGEAEPIWGEILQDAIRGRLQPLYRAGLMGSLAGLPLPRYELLNLRHYWPFPTYVVTSSRGCPFRCEFCSEHLLLGDAYRCRPAADVVAEVRHCRGRNYLFGDSNFGGKRGRAMELMEALIPLKVRWSALWSAYLCLDDEFMDLAQRSGLLHLNLGIESIRPETLDGMNKRFNKTHQYSQMLRNLQRRGISYSLNFIFGWDGEGPEAFDATLQFLHEHKVPVAYFNILTPVKGTPLYERLHKEGRILATEEIDRWPGQRCHIQPVHGTPVELERKVRHLCREFYSLPSILNRLRAPRSKADLASWVINLSQRSLALSAETRDSFDAY